jgi:predicted Zn-dependent protease
MQELLEIMHGSLAVKVPSELFSGCDARIDTEAAEEFKGTLQSRYPWLSANSLDVLMETARRKYIEILDEETKGSSKAERLRKQGKQDSAEQQLRRNVERYPEDPDVWYALGRMLCETGRKEEGYEAFNRGRSLFRK